MMKIIAYLLTILLLVVGCNRVSENDKIVVVKGSIANYDQDTLYMSNVSSKLMLFEEQIRKAPLTDKSSFEFRFELDKPTYFQIGRTFLYLSPGDSLEASLDTRDRTYASFSGTGAEANNYLANVPYPKGGSYWGDRKICQDITTYEDMPDAFKQSVKKRLDELYRLRTVSDEFRRLETARTKFDYVNSLSNSFYLYYKKVRNGEMTQEEMMSKIAEANAYFEPYQKKYLDDFNQTDYLQLEVFHAVLYTLNDDFRAKLQLPELNKTLKEYILTAELVNTVKFNGYSNQIGDKLKKGMQEVLNPVYQKVLNGLAEGYQTITKGSLASDLTFKQLDGSSIQLSEFKGKIIVLDLWATWCGPCMEEKPFFDALEKKYHGNEDVKLISLSIDNEKVWRKYFEKNEAIGTQLQINRSQLSDYKVAGIPRFFVIDQEFKIVDVFAPLPSTGELETLINNILKS